MAWVRLFAVPFALLEVGVFKEDYPPGYEQWAWALTAIFALGAIVFLVLADRVRSRSAWGPIALAALAFDSAVVYGYILVYAFEPGTPVRQLVFIPLIEAALRYGLLGGLAMPVISAAALSLTEWWREEHFPPQQFQVDNVTLPVGVQLILGVIVGSLVN